MLADRALHSVAVAMAVLVSQMPRWGQFEGVRLGDPVDEILALNAKCWPLVSPGATEEFFYAPRVASEAFGYSLPHDHPSRDTAAVRRALEAGTICQVRLLDGRGRAVVLAVDRRVVAATVYFFADDTSAMGMDSVRALVRARWPRPTSTYPTLDSWTGGRFVAYLLDRQVPSRARPTATVGSVKLILVDRAACSAFERRVHQTPGTGPADAC